MISSQKLWPVDQEPGHKPLNVEELKWRSTPENIVQRWTAYADGSSSKSYVSLKPIDIT
jgi:hypothetical protein